MTMQAGIWAAAARSSRLSWAVLENQRARLAAQRRHVESRKARAVREVAQTRAERATRPVHGRTTDAECRELATLRAEVMADRIDGIAQAMGSDALRDWLCSQVEGLGADARAFRAVRHPDSDTLRSYMERARCPLWWRRQLKRAAVRMREAEGVRTGEVSRKARQPYVTNDTNERMRARRAGNAAMLEATELENEDGQVMTLAELAATSTANPAIRRGELMTRIAGCEKLADGLGHRGVFLTLTAPSRFHSQGGENPRYEGATPRDSHAWLCATWAKARARLQRIGVRCYGFRVAEPHADGCAHWHALLWTEPGQLWRLVLNLRRWWLKDSGLEPGARAHRLKAVLMQPGGAAGYCAKYVAKNIDDVGAVAIEGHRDESAEGRQVPLIDGTAARVQAWASAWGIRQFQAIGQPPVTVWRELRRVDEANQAGAGRHAAMAFQAVNRQGERRADWALYVVAQGGLMRGREYLVRVATELREKVGRYETAEKECPVGVLDVTAPGQVHPSNRREWKPRGAWGARANSWELKRAGNGGGATHAYPAVHPWTRVNNCTRRGGPAFLMRAGLVGVLNQNRGVRTMKEQKCPIPEPPPMRWQTSRS